MAGEDPLGSGASEGGWVEDDTALVAFAGGGGLQAHRGEDEVELAALVGRHGRKGEGESGLADMDGSALGRGEEGVIAIFLVAVGVAGEEVVLVRFQAADFGREVLDGLEEFGVAGGEVFGVRAGELDGEIGNGTGVLLDGEGKIEPGCVHDAPKKSGDLRLGDGWLLHSMVPFLLEIGSTGPERKVA